MIASLRHPMTVPAIGIRSSERLSSVRLCLAACWRSVHSSARLPGRGDPHVLAARRLELLRSNRLPSLDGLRALAALMVVVGHAGKVLQVGRHLPFGSGVIDVWGPVGVTVFFVLSGFLITRLLVQDRRESATIHLRAFYVRRAFRILPAYWVYMAAIAVMARGHLVLASPSGFTCSLTFTTDYLNPHSWVMNHSWSLSVEEQFYLVWPILLMAAGEKRARLVAQWLIVIAPLLRVFTFYATPGLRPSITAMFHLRADALMIGSWAALESLRPDSRVLAFLRRPGVALGGALDCVLLAAGVRRLELVQGPCCGFGRAANRACRSRLREAVSSETRQHQASPMCACADDCWRGAQDECRLFGRKLLHVAQHVAGAVHRVYPTECFTNPVRERLRCP